METSTALFSSNLHDKDKEMLQSVAHRLLAHGSLLRSRSSEKALYDWAVTHQEWVEEWAELLGLQIILQRDDRLLMALPLATSLTRRLRKEETLVALALWFDYDIEVRENGAHEVFFSVKEFNESLNAKFPTLQPLSASRLREILRSFARYNLIETEWTDDFADSIIQVLPVLRFAIPFPDIESWLKTANAFNEAEKEKNETNAEPESKETASEKNTETAEQHPTASSNTDEEADNNNQ